jgi:hypothetical protein
VRSRAWAEEESAVGKREQRISERAYAIWERAGRPDGEAEQHWRLAEAEVDQEMTAPAGSGTKGKAPARSAKRSAKRASGKKTK